MSRSAEEGRRQHRSRDGFVERGTGGEVEQQREDDAAEPRVRPPMQPLLSVRQVAVQLGVRAATVKEQVTPA